MRSIKHLALAALVAGALAAVPAGASASGGIVADEYPVTLHGKSSSEFIVSLQGYNLRCETPKFEVLAKGPWPSFSTTAAKVPCYSWQGAPLEMNGCKFEFQPDTSTMDIGPAGCGPITTSAGVCKFQIGAQTGLPATYENYGSGSEAKGLITPDVASLKFTMLSGNGCGSGGTFSNGSIDGHWDVTGENAGKEPVGVHIETGDLPIGLFMSNGEFPASGTFNAQAFPVSITGEQYVDSEGRGFKLLDVKGSALRCNEAQFNVEMPSASEELSLHPELEDCYFGSTPATVDVNSCNYLFHGGEPEFEGASHYNGWGEVACSGGELIEVSVSSPISCSFKIGSQEMTGTQEYQNNGASIDATVTVEAESKLQITKEGSGFFCGLLGKNGPITGSMAGKITLRGVYTG